MALKSIPLKSLKSLADWKHASLGALLQGHASDGGIVVGMRCDMKVHGLVRPAFLVLDGDRRGTLIEDGGLMLPVIDVSGLVEICVTDLGPIAFDNRHHATYGMVCESGGGSGIFFVRATTVGGMRGYAFIADPTGSYAVGAVEGGNPPPEMMVIGLTSVAEIAR